MATTGIESLQDLYHGLPVSKLCPKKYKSVVFPTLLKIAIGVVGFLTRQRESSFAMDLNGPALAPPEGVIPNLDNPPNNNGLAIGVLSACTAIATVCLFIRAYARIWLLRKVQIEEGLTLCAYGCFWGAIYAEIGLIDTPGYFVHQWNVRLKDMILAQYYVFLFGVFYTIVLPLLKVTILIGCCRMFAPRGHRSEGYFWWGCVVVIIVQITAGIGIVVALNLQCIPHSAIWDITILATSKCFDLYKLQVASASIQLISDVAILLLPQQVIWSLKMTWRKRMGVSFIFGLGLLACISAAFRLETTIAHGRSADAVWTLPPLAFWATAEMTCGFFIVALPCIPKIMMETGAGAKIKSILGMSSLGNSSKRNWESEGTGQSSNPSKLGRSTTDNTYYNLDTLKSSESTEYLRKGAGTHDEDHKGVYP
ncbi:hypothetical protein PENCOP_c015G07554 [Penicillium coprophilum]|uniref:Rhodopsin domain-containing protein n=1 Tax=Penicillium coprophilum TaxID=36646 RepID=A0A1V6U8Q0_9EURO|nr:hypothetical protein PENCOP_c015G07554 [Penicillium coprophilum]